MLWKANHDGARVDMQNLRILANIRELEPYSLAQGFQVAARIP